MAAVAEWTIFGGTATAKIGFSFYAFIAHNCEITRNTGRTIFNYLYDGLFLFFWIFHCSSILSYLKNLRPLDTVITSRGFARKACVIFT